MSRRSRNGVSICSTLTLQMIGQPRCARLFCAMCVRARTFTLQPPDDLPKRNHVKGDPVNIQVLSGPETH